VRERVRESERERVRERVMERRGGGGGELYKHNENQIVALHISGMAEKEID
jgi:hypothetical protein